MKDAIEFGPDVSFHDNREAEQHRSRKRGVPGSAEREAHLLRAGAALWGAVIREGSLPAEDTQAALQAIQASLNAARRLRFAACPTESERRRQEDTAAEAAEQQAQALWLWYDQRGFGRDEIETVAARKAFRAENRHVCAHVCREIRTEKEFRGLRDEWNALLAECSYPSPFCTWEWSWEWWRHFGADDPADYRLLVALAYRPDGKLIGLAPFFFPSTTAGPLRLRPLRPLATRIRCMVDDMTEEPVILLHREATAEALQGLWTGLSAWNGRRDWDLLHWRLMRRASEPDLSSVWRRMPRTLPFVLTRPRRRLGQTRSLPPSWPEFCRSLGKSMRDNIAYYPRLLTREGHPWAVRIARTPTAVAAALPSLITLHGCRARSERGPAHLDHLPGSVQQRFLHDVLVRLSAQNRAAVALLEVNGRAVAAQATLETAGRMTFYYSGFDPHWHRYSPITVLHIALLQDAIARGLTGVDYLPEAESWKTRWGTEAEYVYDELSCLSIHPRALFRSAWRKVIFFHSRRRGSACECGFCTPAEQALGMPTARIAPAHAGAERKA